MAGCIEPPIIPPLENETPVEPPVVTCTTFTEEVPATEEVCENFSYTDEICGKKQLEYSAILLPKTHLCIQDGPCVGQPLASCPTCSKAMSRCILVVTNEDEEYSGTWTVSATFSVDQSGFIKEPITKTIAPNESFNFDFYQIYVVGSPIQAASCDLPVTSAPIVDDCHQETRIETECTNVTTTKLVEVEVCE